MNNVGKLKTAWARDGGLDDMLNKLFEVVRVDRNDKRTKGKLGNSNIFFFSFLSKLHTQHEAETHKPRWRVPYSTH